MGVAMKEKQKIREMKKSAINLVSNDQLDSENWQVAGVPVGDGKFWMYQDDNAITKAIGEDFEIEIPRFSRSHNSIQIFDNPKQLYLTKKSYEPGPRRIIGFSCAMKAQVINADLNDYRDGFCAFNVLDFSSGMVFDIVSNGRKIWAVYERLLMPGLTTDKQAFTRFVLIDHPTKLDENLNCSIIYDQNADRAEYYLDDKLIFVADNIPVKIKSLQSGFGIITFHPIHNGQSVSCKGQGALGRWGKFAFYLG
jgi:hypothetical protein